VKPVLLLTRKILPLTLALLLAGCAADRYRKEGLSLISEGRLEDGLAKLTLAQQTDSSDASIRKDWLMQREEITRRLMAEGNRERGAEHWDVALQRFNRVLSIDPGHIAAPQAITELTLARKQVLRLDEAAIKIQKGEFEPASALVGKVLIEAPSHPRALQLRTQLAEATQNDSFNGVSLNLKGRKPVTLQFREANLRMVMEAISKTTGLNVMFDKDVKSDLKVTIFVRDTPVEEAIDLILMQTQTTKRVMSENSILVYPDTETKGREYAELKIRRFSLTNADPKQVMAMVKAMVKTKDMFIDEKTNALIVRDTPQIIRLVEKLVATMDQPEPEVMLEVDVMEISRARALALGIDLPTSFGTSLTSMTVDQLKALGRNDFFSNAGVTITANKTDSDINDLATPRIRVRNKEKAKILVGDRLPVISSAATPSTTGAAPVYNTSVQYVEVGIKIEVEPTIYADGDVAIRLTLEVNSKGDQAPDVAKNGTIAYTIGTRSLSTVLRLKDGQTEVIGGLIQDQDRTGANRVPGFGDIPLLGRLFGKQTDTKNKSEIIMSITPHIVRNNRQADGDLLEMWSGTENNLRYGSKVVGASRTQLPTPSMPAAATPGAASPTASASRSGVARPAPALAAKAAGQATGTQITARPVALMPVVLSAPQAAKPGEQISVALALPALPAATQLDLTLAYDPATLRFVSVTEAGAERNAAVGARFTGDAEGAGSVHMELTAGRGESLPAGGGALAQVQFEVLTAAGPTQINISNATLHSADAGDQPLPMTPAVGVEIKAAP